MKVALQFYTVRDSYQDAEGFKQTLKKIKDIGYHGVEFAGYAGIEAAELKEYLKEIGLEVVSSHHTLDELDANKEEIFAYVSELGCDIVTCSFSMTENREQVDRTVRVMKDCVQKAEQYGLKIAYHNHSHEFNVLADGRIPIEEIGECCALETDTYWVFHAKINPVEYIKEKESNIILVHIKDGDLEGNPCALGEGDNDIKGVVDAAKDIGMDWVIVENDCPQPDGISDVTRSFGYLKNIMHGY